MDVLGFSNVIEIKNDLCVRCSILFLLDKVVRYGGFYGWFFRKRSSLKNWIYMFSFVFVVRVFFF